MTEQPGTTPVKFIPQRAYVVSHTHWDREWYLTYHTFRVNFTRVVQQVLDQLEGEPEFRHFLLDGQTAILEDYLEVHPEDEVRVRRLAEAGKLSLGPWYILPDEFLVSAEAHIRNLVYGHQVAGEFGSAQKAGYMPDSFGHIAQLPQILRLAGIDNFVFTRGVGDEIDDNGFEFHWMAPDGSSVLAVNQCGGYCNAAGLGFEEIWHAHTRRTVDTQRAVSQVRDLFNRLGEHSNGNIVLLNNGCDHFPPQQEFPRVMAALRGAFPETEFIHCSLTEYIERVRQAGIAGDQHTGELLGGRLHHILSGVWSARMYLKQLNDTAQHWLSGYLEPLAAYTHFCQQQPYASGLIDYAWKLLLKNHPHDSICGCSIDEVHREMLPRFSGVIETASQESMRLLESLAPTFARDAADDRETILCVFNPLPWRRDAVIRRMVVLQPLGYDIDALQLVDETGNPVEFRVIDRWYIERFWGVDYRTMFSVEDQLEKLEGYLAEFGDRILKDDNEADSADCFLLIEFRATDLPAMGHVNYHLTETATPAAESAEKQGQASILENDLIRLEVKTDGSFDLVDKRSGRKFAGLNRLESSEDIGDEYDYSPAVNGVTLDCSAAAGSVSRLEDAGLRQSVRVAFDWELPTAISPDRTTRSSETVGCPVEICYSIDDDSPVVDISLRFGNLANDHRLRALFPAAVKTETLSSHGHFHVNRRPVEIPMTEHWTQPHPATYPQQDFSMLEDDNGGLALFNRGLPEVTPLIAEDQTAGIALALLRSVGWLSRDDFPTRRNSNAGPTVPTPDAQCIGDHLIHYALMPLAGDHGLQQVIHASAEWRTPPLVIQGVADQAVPGGTGLITQPDPVACITAIKRHQQRDSLVIRLYNPHDTPVAELLELLSPISKCWVVNALEERLDRLDLASERDVLLKLRPHEILTVELEFAE